ncbi:chloride conductance regulatory protein ICln [Lolium perenne]|uniref:chloride conductance regulatory protein ICln n=1 Tax=Lolium perenne TaxID=4522 RepID=UPI0021F634B6|nr:chloride conductance regulatory protein ICln-like [Lolium perenne]
MAPGLKIFADIAGDGTPRLDAASGEEVVCVERAASVALGRRAPEAPGTLFVTTRRVIWLSEAEKGTGYAVEFLDVTLHAVSRDPETYPSPCLYTQIEAEAGSDEEAGDLDTEPLSELQLAKISEMRIILSDAAQLDSLFDAFCHCAELNPDPTAEQNEEDGWFHGEDMTDGGWIHGDEIMVDGIDPEFFTPNPIGENDGSDLSRSVLELQINDQRFEDADEDEEVRENGH